MVHQFDVVATFLHEDIDKEVFLNQTAGFADEKHRSMLWKLPKSHQELNQSGRCWFIKMVDALLESGSDKTAPEQ